MVSAKNKCNIDNGGCEHFCEEHSGKFYRCKCKRGYRLASDKRKCHRMLYLSVLLEVF